MSLIKLQVPDWYRAGFTTRIGLAPTISGFDKVFAHHVLSNFTDAQQFNAGVTHLSKLDTPGFPNAKKCYLFKPEIFPSSNPSIGQIQSAADTIAAKITAQSVIADQFREGEPSQPDNYGTSNIFYRRLSQQLGAGAANNNLMWTYDSYDASFNADFFDILGIGANIPLDSRFVNALGSEAGARKKARNNGSVQADDPYYGLGMHEFTNSLTMSLFSIDGINEHWFAHKVFESQRKYIAYIDANTLWETSPWMQSVLTGIDSHHTNPGWIHERDGGYWVVPIWHVIPPAYAVALGFFSSLLSQGPYVWEGLPTLSDDIANDRVEPYAPAPRWVSAAGKPAPTLAPYNDGNSPYYPKYPASVIDEVGVGVHWYNQARPIVNASSGIAYTSAVVNGEHLSVQPGDPRLSRKGFRNFGQDTVLHRAAGQKGFSFGCQGAGARLACYFNPYLSPTKKEDVTMNVADTNIYLGQLEGSWPHVFIYS